jgi:hypothetical protein
MFKQTWQKKEQSPNQGSRIFDIASQISASDSFPEATTVACGDTIATVLLSFISSILSFTTISSASTNILSPDGIVIV